jgi:hypothetical protein
MSITTHPANAPVTPTSESTETLECCQKHLALINVRHPSGMQSVQRTPIRDD